VALLLLVRTLFIVVSIQFLWFCDWFLRWIYRHEMDIARCFDGIISWR